MKNISNEFAQIIYRYLEGKFSLSQFENWVYKNGFIENELEQDDYLSLISINFSSKESAYELSSLLHEFLKKYVEYAEEFSESSSIKAICITNKGQYKSDLDKSSFDVTINRCYDILSIQYLRDSKGNYDCLYRVIDDHESIFLIPSNTMKLENNIIPENWIIDEDRIGGVNIEPKEWNDKYYKGKFSFWEDFYNDEESAFKAFVSVLRRMNVKIPELYRGIAIKLMIENEKI
jgi:hypothetical protein